MYATFNKSSRYGPENTKNNIMKVSDLHNRAGYICLLENHIMVIDGKVMDQFSNSEVLLMSMR